MGLFNRKSEQYQLPAKLEALLNMALKDGEITEKKLNVLRAEAAKHDISEDELDLIWNRYYRTKETHKRAVIGSGLGLHIVQTILDQHHVPYGVKSTLKVGTTFWFELPIYKNTAEEA